MNGIKYVEDLPLPRSQKARFIYQSFREISIARSSIRTLYNAGRPVVPLGTALPFWKTGLAQVGPVPVLPLFDEIVDDIVADSGGGTVYFAHLLAPHSPYVLESDCTVISDLDRWRSRRILSFDWSEPNSAESRALSYEAYAEQLRCTNRRLAAFFEGLRVAGVLDDAIIVVHGDHGSRINRNWPTVPNRDVLRDSDFIDGYPTLFAAKGPGVPVGYSTERTTLTTLLATTFGMPERAPADTGVFLFGGIGGRFERGRMPEQWMDPPEGGER
jgi:arylsulfatase A-like enzyme